MNKKRTVVGVFLFLLAIIVAGGVWYGKNWKTDERENLIEESKQQEAIADFSKYNKVLPEQKITGVKDINGPYKKVTVSNGEITFSFEVPDNWLTELRNSGETEMTEEELREFLGTTYGEYEGWETDYSGYFRSNLQAMNYKELQDAFRGARGDFYPGFPNATVTPDNKIWYTDTEWDQANFYVVSKQEGIRYLENDKKSLARHLQNQEPELRKKIETKWENQIVSGRKALVALYSMDITEEGKYFVSKGGTGGRKYFIEVNDASTLILQKEAYVEGEFEEGFKHLLGTLSFE